MDKLINMIQLINFIMNVVLMDLTLIYYQGNINNSIFLLSIMKHNIHGNINFILRFNVINSLNDDPELSFQDYTCQLMEFLYDNILKQNLNKSIINQLFNALGIPLCYFTKDMPNHSIQQINQILQQQNGGSSTKQKDKLSRKINEFLYQQEHNQGYYIDLNNILILKDIE